MAYTSASVGSATFEFISCSMSLSVVMHLFLASPSNSLKLISPSSALLLMSYSCWWSGNICPWTYGSKSSSEMLCPLTMARGSAFSLSFLGVWATDEADTRRRMPRNGRETLVERCNFIGFTSGELLKDVTFHDRVKQLLARARILSSVKPHFLCD